MRAAFPDATFDELDGLTVQLGDGAWFNLRASNTEPLLRLNVEAPKPDRMAALRDEVLAIVARVRIAVDQGLPPVRVIRSRSVALDPQLLDILACPDTHHAPLTTTPTRRP